MKPLSIGPDDPQEADVQVLLEQHLRFAHEYTDHGAVYALDVEALLQPSIRFFSVRREGQLLAVGALSHLSETHVELKSMHTTVAARGLGIAEALLQYLLKSARTEGYLRMSLETGSMDAFMPARSLYSKLGFRRCEPLLHYPDSPLSTFMDLELAET